MRVLQILVSLILCCNMCTSASELVLVISMARHAERTAINPYPTDPNKNSELYTKYGYGQLTDNGKLQEIELGKYLQTTYSELLNDPKYVYVQATEDERVKQSAECNLARIFPKYGVFNTDGNKVSCSTKVPIKVVPKKEDNVLQMEASCPAYQTHLARKAIKEAFVELKKPEIRAMLKELTRNAGYKLGIMTPIQMYQVYDACKVEEDNKLPLPEWIKGVYPEPLQGLVILGFKARTWDDKLKRLLVGPLLNEIIYNMERKISGDNPLKACMYYAHDTTIVNLLNTLGVYDGKHLPDYAACVMLELWQDDDGQYYVKLYYMKSYKDERIELNPLACDSKCYFQDFKRKCSKYISDDWKKECRFGFGKKR